MRDSKCGYVWARFYVHTHVYKIHPVAIIRCVLLRPNNKGATIWRDIYGIALFTFVAFFSFFTDWSLLAYHSIWWWVIFGEKYIQCLLVWCVVTRFEISIILFCFFFLDSFVAIKVVWNGNNGAKWITNRENNPVSNIWSRNRYNPQFYIKAIQKKRMKLLWRPYSTSMHTHATYILNDSAKINCG